MAERPAGMFHPSNGQKWTMRVARADRAGGESGRRARRAAASAGMMNGILSASGDRLDMFMKMQGAVFAYEHCCNLTRLSLG
jgi:hypothetical protein